MLIDAVKVIECVLNVSGSNDKMRVLKANEEVEGLKEILKFIYNPYLKTGISDRSLSNALPYVTGDGIAHDSYKMVMQYLAQNNTGSDVDITLAANFVKGIRRLYEGDMYAVLVARAIVTQNLQIGIGVTSLNKIWGADFIPKTGCMLGTLYGSIPAHKLEWPYIVTEKLDGIRRVIIKEDGIARAYSRSGHEDTGLVEIMADVKHLPNNMVYDGELIATGLFRDSIAKRQATMSIAQSKGLKYGLTFNVFDMIPIDEFNAGTSKEGALNRKIRLGATLMDESIQHLHEDWAQLIQAFGIHVNIQHIKFVPILGLATGMHDVEPIVEVIWGRRDEGVMLNSATGLYEIKRSKHLLKLKHTEECQLEVIDMIEGTNKYEDMLGALVVNYKGYAVGVGSGFSDSARQQLWDHPEHVIGRWIEIESFGESMNASGGISLNCPVFLRFVDEVHE